MFNSCVPSCQQHLRNWCLTAPFLGQGYSVEPTAGQQPHISLYKVRRSAVCKLIALISKVLLDDGNRILNPPGIFLFFTYGEGQATAPFSFVDRPTHFIFSSGHILVNLGYTSIRTDWYYRLALEWIVLSCHYYRNKRVHVCNPPPSKKKRKKEKKQLLYTGTYRGLSDNGPRVYQNHDVQPS